MKDKPGAAISRMQVEGQVSRFRRSFAMWLRAGVARSSDHPEWLSPTLSRTTRFVLSSRKIAMPLSPVTAPTKVSGSRSGCTMTGGAIVAEPLLLAGSVSAKRLAGPELQW